MKLLAALTLALSLGTAAAYADSVNVAVAANFTAAAEKLAEAFKAETGDELVLSFGASGALYTQVTQGAPFDVFLSADDTHPKKAIDDGLGVAGTNFTYAVGSLVLYSTTLDVSVGEAALNLPFNKLAIGNPESAPYGIAAVEALKTLGKYDAILPKLVIGENISQTLQFVDSGNAELGFVAASQVIGKGSQWLVPTEDHEPILQDAVLLKTGAAKPAAAKFLEYLKSDAAVAIITSAGYTVPAK
ncbi:molybdate ABC transporter substrate-binding protein [Devosia sp.]|uniref:molybdate ABC transporter substrate-binding protein n=1 Tax=Devosia sp. TaxID=1871048 RepID=UPI00326369AF